MSFPQLATRSMPAARSGVAFAQQLRTFGDRPALLTDHRTLSYTELADRVDYYRNRLGTTQRLVLIQLQPQTDLIALYLAALADQHPVIIAPHDNDQFAAELAERFAVNISAKAEIGFPQLVEHHQPGDGEPTSLHPDLALLLSTSGATGSPKLVRLSQVAVQSNAEAIAESLDISANDRAITSLPLHYCYGLSVLHSHLARGAGVVLTELSLMTPCFWTLAQRHGVTTLATVPYSFDLIESYGSLGELLPRLRTVTQAGGKLPARQVRELAKEGKQAGWRLFVMYGQTEATARMAVLPAELAVSHAHTVGRAIPGGAFRIELPSDSPQDTPAGAVGELTYHGPNVMLGYASEAADLGKGREINELATGDLARWTPDGYLEIVGRRSRFAKILGLRVDLDHLQSQLSQSVESVVVTDPTSTRLQVLLAHGAGAAELSQVRQAAMQATQLPAHLISVATTPAEQPELPRRSNGKLDYAAAQRYFACQAGTPQPTIAADPATTASTDPVESIKRLYQELLGTPEVSEHDSFISLGGDSLSYVETTIRLEELLEKLPEDWPEQPIGRLAERASPALSQRRWWRPLDTSIVLRAVAIALIVGSHTNVFTLLGGAHVLIVVLGYNYARFLLPAAESTRALWRQTGLAVRRLALPAMAWISFTIICWGAYPWTSAFLVHSLIGDRSWGPAWHLWFIEAAVYLVLAATALLSIPHLRQAHQRYPFALPFGLSLLALVLRYDLVGLSPDPGLRFLWYGVAWLFFLGWAAATARTTTHQLGLTLVLSATVPGFFDTTARAALLILGVLILIWWPTLPWPTRLIPLTSHLATSSLSIYLVHWQIYPHFEHTQPMLGWLLSLAAGVLAWHLCRRLIIRGENYAAHPVDSARAFHRRRAFGRHFLRSGTRGGSGDLFGPGRVTGERDHRRL